MRIREQGRIGAEKIFHYLKRFNEQYAVEGLQRGVSVIKKRTRYVRAMNFVIADTQRSRLVSTFGEDPDYFQLHRTQLQGLDIVCSAPLPEWTGWTSIENGSILNL